MTKSDAVRLLEIVERFGLAFNDATAITLQLPDTSEAKRIREILGEVAIKSFELSELVTRQYPELKDST